jgi:hypothetical protein
MQLSITTAMKNLDSYINLQLQHKLLNKVVKIIFSNRRVSYAKSCVKFTVANVGIIIQNHLRFRKVNTTRFQRCRLEREPRSYSKPAQSNEIGMHQQPGSKIYQS